MRNSGIVERITAHRGLASLPDVWVELAHGQVSTEEARRRAVAEEDEALVERTARMLAPPTSAQAQARLQGLLERLEPVEAPEPAWPASVRRWVVVTAAVAAAVLLLVLVPRSPPMGPAAFEAGYELELGRALAVERGVPEPSREIPRYRVDRAIQLTLRPAHRVTDAIGVRAFAARGDEPPLVLPIEPRVSPLGVVEILGQPRAWGLSPGRWRLTVVVGPPTGLPETAPQVHMDVDAPYDVQQAWIEILEDAPEQP